MKTTIYTYRKKQVVLVEVDKYYHVENKNQLDKVIDSLIEIDAVFTPTEISYPCILKLKSGFGCELVVSDTQSVQQDLNKLKKQVRSLTEISG